MGLILLLVLTSVAVEFVSSITVTSATPDAAGLCVTAAEAATGGGKLAVELVTCPLDGDQIVSDSPLFERFHGADSQGYALHAGCGLTVAGNAGDSQPLALSNVLCLGVDQQVLDAAGVE